MLFISDLHLDPTRQEITDLFLDFLASDAANADALYVLGDLFEAWIGDDDPSAHHAAVKQALRRLADGGTASYFMHGNRDFLIGDAFARETGMTLLTDPTVIRLHGQPTLLMHGDTLCTDDVDYQKVRSMFHDPAWQQAFLARSLDEREAFARQARAESQAAQSGKSMEIMDVNPLSVEGVMRKHGVARLIHGHTHRPGIHTFPLAGRVAQRIVLGDWYEQGSVLRATPAGMSLLTLQRGR